MPIGRDNGLDGPAMRHGAFALAAAVTEFTRHGFGRAIDGGNVLVQMLSGTGNAHFDPKPTSGGILGFAIENECRAVAVKAGPALLTP